VLAGPTCPVERIPPDPRCADRPVSGAEIIFVSDAGDSVGDALSDADNQGLVGGSGESGVVTGSSTSCGLSLVDPAHHACGSELGDFRRGEPQDRS
jgi:hypothetical protein